MSAYSNLSFCFKAKRFLWVVKGPFIHSANVNASNANTNANATFGRFSHSNKSRTWTRKPSTDYEAARLSLAWDIKFRHLELWRRYIHTQRRSEFCICTRKKTLNAYKCLSALSYSPWFFSVSKVIDSLWVKRQQSTCSTPICMLNCTRLHTLLLNTRHDYQLLFSIV